MSFSFSIAEKSAGRYRPLILLRGALVIAFLWFGGMKFTAYEANGIAPLIAHSPNMSWLHTLLGIQGASDGIGVIELSTAAALIAGAFVRFGTRGGHIVPNLRHHVDVLLEHTRRCRTEGRGFPGYLGSHRTVSAQGYSAPCSFRLPLAGVIGAYR